MVIGSMMTGERKKRIIADLEEQGATARETKKGIMIFAPNSNDMRTISAISGDVKGLRDDIAWFRRHGLVHPADRKEQPKMGRSAATNEEGYPLYVVGPINGTTRKRVLAELERKGWPLRVRPTELSMDTVTATRALYNVGYRWDKSTPTKSRVWIAPDDIKEMHERVKAEMDRREQEAREARHAGHEGVEGHSMQIVKTDAIVGMVRDAIKDVKRPTVVDVMNAIDATEPPLRGDLEEAVPTAEVVPSEPPKTVGRVVFQEKQEDYALASFVEEKPETHEREFVDDVDSWTVDKVPEAVRDYLDLLRGAGLEAEVRVWRKQ